MKTKSTNLLAKGYELIDGITVPVGTSNIDLDVEGKEPKNAKKLTIDAGNGKINMYVFRPSGYKAGETTPLIYFIHGGGYHFGNVSMDEPKIQGIADGSGATSETDGGRYFHRTLCRTWSSSRLRVLVLDASGPQVL